MFDTKHENSLNSPPSNQMGFGINSRAWQRQTKNQQSLQEYFKMGKFTKLTGYFNPQ